VLQAEDYINVLNNEMTAGQEKDNYIAHWQFVTSASPCNKCMLSALTRLTYLVLRNKGVFLEVELHTGLQRARYRSSAVRRQLDTFQYPNSER